ncbi:MAG: hypothetical protein R6V03_09340 [Kiritimatiellia bacterium]
MKAKTFWLTYLLGGILGTAGIVFGVPFYKTSTVEMALSECAHFSRLARPEQSLRVLREVKPRSAPYPLLASRVCMGEIQSNLELDRYRAAVRAAEQLRLHDFRPADNSQGIWSAVAAAGDSLANAVLKTGDTAPTPDWSGYITIVDYLYSSGSYDELNDVARTILAVDPDNPIGRNALKSVAGGLAHEGMDSGTGIREAPPSETADSTSPQESDGKTAPTQKRRKVENWGIVRLRRAEARDTSGTVAGTVPLGTLVDIYDVQTIRNTKYALCDAVYEGDQVCDILIAVDDLHVRPGPLAGTTAVEKKLRIELAGLLFELQKESRKQNNANPHADQYRRAKKEYDEFWAKVKTLQKKRDNSTGAEHMRCADQLRMMKGQDRIVHNNLKEARKKYEKWEEQHGTRANPRLDELQRQVAEIRQELSRFANAK